MFFLKTEKKYEKAKICNKMENNSENILMYGFDVIHVLLMNSHLSPMNEFHHFYK